MGEPHWPHLLDFVFLVDQEIDRPQMVVVRNNDVYVVREIIAMRTFRRDLVRRRGESNAGVAGHFAYDNCTKRASNGTVLPRCRGFTEVGANADVC